MSKAIINTISIINIISAISGRHSAFSILNPPPLLPHLSPLITPSPFLAPYLPSHTSTPHPFKASKPRSLFTASSLGRRCGIKDVVRRLRLPAPFLDSKDLRTRLAPLLSIFQKGCADDNLVAQDMLVMIGMGGAVGTVETIH